MGVMDNPVLTKPLSLAELLRRARGTASMREVARRSGLSAAQISRLEAGEIDRSSLETLTRIAEALERPPELLLAATGRIRTDQASAIVQRWLRAIPPGRAGHLAGALHYVRDRETALHTAQFEQASLDPQIASATDERDSARIDRSRSEDKVADLTELARTAPNPEAVSGYEQQLAVAQNHLRAASQAEDQALKQLEGLGARAQAQDAHLVEEQRRFDNMLRACAGQLFVRDDLGPPPPVELFDPRVRAALTRRTNSDSVDEAWTDFLSAVYPTPTTPDDVASWRQTFDQLQRRLQDWEEARARLLHKPDDQTFRQIARAWDQLTAERRHKVLDFVEDQRRLSSVNSQSSKEMGT